MTVGFLSSWPEVALRPPPKIKLASFRGFAAYTDRMCSGGLLTRKGEKYLSADSLNERECADLFYLCFSLRQSSWRNLRIIRLAECECGAASEDEDPPSPRYGAASKMDFKPTLTSPLRSRWWPRGGEGTTSQKSRRTPNAEHRRPNSLKAGHRTSNARRF